MSDDLGRGHPGAVPAHGNAGPVDPRADPVTEPALRAPAPAEQATRPVALPSEAAPSEPSEPSAPSEPSGTPTLRHSRTGGLWVGLILSALVLLVLLVFILQNGQPVQISFFAFEGVLPTGVALLLAAIAGILLVAIPGSLRILQLRRAARRGPRSGG
jgi:uncharacterized integral membrane protein